MSLHTEVESGHLFDGWSRDTALLREILKKLISNKGSGELIPALTHIHKHEALDKSITPQILQ